MTARITCTVAAAALAMATVAGCGLLNAPERDEIVRERDAGVPMDAGRDAGPPRDAGVDAEITDGGCARYQMQETYCDNGIDDDCDELFDCDDNAGCGSAAACCLDGPSEMTRWTSTPDHWAVLRRTVVEPVVVDEPSGTITQFGTSGAAQAFRHNTCTPIVLGLRVSIELTPTNPDCTADVCASYAGIVFTGATEFPPSGRLLDDFRVAMRSDGLVEVTQGGREIRRSNAAVEQDTKVTLVVELSIGGDSAGNPAVFARVSQEGAEDILPGVIVMPIDQLLATCPVGPGLYIAVEGANSGVHVGTVTIEQLECANPSRFADPAATIMSSTVAGATSWPTGGIGAPSLSNYFMGAAGTMPRFDLVYDASNQPRTDETFTRVMFAIGRARAINVTDPIWPLPRLGALVLSDVFPCEPGSTTSPCARAMRDPFLLVTSFDKRGIARNMDGFVAHADAAAPDVYQLVHVQTLAGGSEPLTRASTPAIAASDLGVAVDEMGDALPPCVSLRDPSLARAGTLGSDGYWLFFTCKRADGLSDIRAVPLSDPEFALRETLPAPVVVATPEQLGAAGALGLHGPEPIAKHLDANRALRVWFVAVGLSGEATVWLAQTQYTSTGVPEFELYPINPILRASSPGLECEGSCTIGSLSVTRRVNDLRQLQFLVARYVDQSAGRVFDLVAMEQTLERFWQTP